MLRPLRSSLSGTGHRIPHYVLRPVPPPALLGLPGKSDDRGKGACALGLGQIALYAGARNERLSGGGFKLYALQGCGPCVSHQRA
jgi:hypothetical protein